MEPLRPQRDPSWMPQPRGPWIAAGIALLIIIVAVSVGSEERERAEASREVEQTLSRLAQEVEESRTQRVVYSVDGSGRASITLSNATGDTEQMTERLPFTRTYTMPAGEFVYISAQKQSDGSGTIECSITVDGEQVAQASSSAAYGIAGCSD